MTTTAAGMTAAVATTGEAITSGPQPFATPVRPGRPDSQAARTRTAELYECYGRTVGRLCRGLLRDRGEAEDAAQQVFLSAHRALLNGTAPREPAAWLATIARNECLWRVRARMREPLPTAEVEGESTLPDPLAEAIRRADLQALWQAIEALPRRQRDALLLRELGGLSYGELAEALAVSRPTVESLLFRARHALRVRLKAAYAALTGASWLDALARLLPGAPAAVAPAATKAVAVAVGAGLLTGGAVVGPRVLHAPASGRPPAAAAAALRAAPHERPSVRRHVPAPRVTAPPPVRPAHDRRGRSGRSNRGDAGGSTTAPRPDGDDVSGPSASGGTSGVAGGTSDGGSGTDGGGSGDTRVSGGAPGPSGESGEPAATTEEATTVATSSGGPGPSEGSSGSGGGSDGSVSGDSGSGGGSGSSGSDGGSPSSGPGGS